MRLRWLSTVLVGAYVSCWIAALAVRLLHVDRALGAAIIIVAAVAGGYGGYRKAEVLQPLTGPERRDAVIGWSIVIGIIGAIACFLSPLPWAILAAIAWVGVVIAVARGLMPRDLSA